MFLWSIKRLKRTPLPAMGVLLFAVAVSVIVCILHIAHQEELHNYETVYHTIPVELTVTNLSATRSEDLEIPVWYLEVFTGSSPNSLGKYAKDVQTKSAHAIDAINDAKYLGEMVGITSLSCDSQLLPENGSVITWMDGYDEAIFAGNEALCIVPQDLLTQLDLEDLKIVIDFSYTISNGYYEEPEIREYQCTFKVAGSYLGGDGLSVYCPYTIVQRIYRQLGETQALDSLRATLSNNDLLEALRSEMGKWFATPNPLAGNHSEYDYALDIDDALLVKTAATLENSITINRVCTAIVYIISAAAGFLIGFLMVRNRKKEIALMRTMGTPDRSIYFGFVFEQMLCVVLGIGLGGSYNGWQPADRLGILAATYFVGLTVALLIFLRQNLLTTLKEE